MWTFCRDIVRIRARAQTQPAIALPYSRLSVGDCIKARVPWEAVVRAFCRDSCADTPACTQTTLHTTAQDLATRHGVWWTDVQKSWCMAEMSIAEQENLVHDKTDTSVRETAETLAALCMVNPHAPPAYGAAHPHPHPQQNGGARHPHEHDSAATLLSMHQR